MIIETLTTIIYASLQVASLQVKFRQLLNCIEIWWRKIFPAAQILENMNQKVDPCDDFYSFACGGFESKYVIPDDKSSVTSFTLIGDEITAQLRDIIERPINESEAEPFKLVKKFYQSCLNKSNSSQKFQIKLKINFEICLQCSTNRRSWFETAPGNSAWVWWMACRCWRRMGWE